GWPELYDEMCAVAARRLYNGWGFAELADHGIGFSLFETPALASLARELVREEPERRTRTLRPTAPPTPGEHHPPADALPGSPRAAESDFIPPERARVVFRAPALRTWPNVRCEGR